MILTCVFDVWDRHINQSIHSFLPFFQVLVQSFVLTLNHEPSFISTHFLPQKLSVSVCELEKKATLWPNLVSIESTRFVVLPKSKSNFFCIGKVPFKQQLHQSHRFETRERQFEIKTVTKERTTEFVGWSKTLNFISHVGILFKVDKQIAGECETRKLNENFGS